MKTEYRRLINCFTQNLGGGDFKYYKIVDEQDLLEMARNENTGQLTVRRVNRERTGPIKVEEITSKEYRRMREEPNNGKNQEG